MADRREHPLLMRPELVRATLAGRKTQTRRLVTPGTSTVHGWPSARAIWPRLDFARAEPVVLRAFGLTLTETPGLSVPIASGDGAGERVVALPRVRPGHVVYVREPWQTGVALDDEAPAMLAAWAKAGDQEPCGPVRYLADGATCDAHLLAPGSHYGETWGRCRPGIHLPRWASRLVLPVSGVKVERVCAISEEDALAEGVGSDITDLQALRHLRGADALRAVPSRPDTARGRFRSLWEQINGNRPGAAWAADPWVWMYQWPRREQTP